MHQLTHLCVQEPRAFSISFASIKASRKRVSPSFARASNHRITKSTQRIVNTARIRRPAFAISLPLRPANPARTQSEQLPLPSFDGSFTTEIPKTTVFRPMSMQQSLPTTNASFILPFHPAPTALFTRNTSQQLSKEEEKNDNGSKS